MGGMLLTTVSAIPQPMQQSTSRQQASRVNSILLLTTRVCTGWCTKTAPQVALQSIKDAPPHHLGVVAHVGL
jgi:hypothetical protein